MDPFASVPVFLMLTKKAAQNERLRAAVSACTVAGAAMVAFILIGPWLLQAMGITLDSFMIAGGLLLLITSVQYFLGIELGAGKGKDVGVEVVLIGVPLLAGPGAMATSVILSSAYGMANTIAASVIAVAVCFMVLAASGVLQKIAGSRGLQVFSKIMAILLAAISVEFIRKGIAGA